MQENRIKSIRFEWAVGLWIVLTLAAGSTALGSVRYELQFTVSEARPTFQGRLLGTDEKFLWTVTDDVWFMDFGSFGKMSGTPE